MMPPQQETTTTPPNISVTNRSENAWVYADPSGSITTHVSPRLEPQMPDDPQAQQPNTPSRFSILQRSLRPVTLKVRKGKLRLD